MLSNPLKSSFNTVIEFPQIRELLKINSPNPFRILLSFFQTLPSICLLRQQHKYFKLIGGDYCIGQMMFSCNAKENKVFRICHFDSN